MLHSMKVNMNSLSMCTMSCNQKQSFVTVTVVLYFRALSGDNVDSPHKSENASDTNYTGTGDLLEDYRDSLESTSLNSGALQALSLTSLAGRPSDKYRSNFELGRPFFGLTSEKHGREQGT